MKTVLILLFLMQQVQDIIVNTLYVKCYVHIRYNYTMILKIIYTDYEKYSVMKMATNMERAEATSFGEPPTGVSLPGVSTIR